MIAYPPAMIIAQISDCHITAADERVADRVDPSIGLRRAIEIINRIGADLVVGSGDLVNDARSDEYDELCALLARLDARFLALPGNHDDRTELRSRFGDLPAGGPDQPIDHVVDVGDLRLVCLDTTIPGRHDGRLTPAQLDWLDDVLAADRDRPAIVVQHHPPVPSGIPSMDGRFGLAGADAEAVVLARHDHVAAVWAGHYHRAFHQRFGGTVATSCPSTAVELALDFEAERAVYSDEPPGMMIHRIVTGVPAGGRGIDLGSHVVALAESTTWVPSWAVGS